MKFNDGYWMLKPGVSAYPCSDARDTVITPESVTLYVAPYKILNRGMTLAGPLLAVCFTSPAEGVLQLRMSHYTGGAARFPEFEITGENPGISAQDCGDEVIISSGKLTAAVRKSDFRIEYSYNGRFLTASGPKQLAYMKTADGAFCRERLTTSVGENYYGFGERFTPFVKNGQTVDIWNEDGGTASEQAYKNVPFCVSNRGYGVFVNHPELVSFEVCSEAVSKLGFSVKGEELRYMIIGGETLPDVISRYTGLTGRPALPPAWSYGLWLSTSFITDYNEETVSSFIDGMSERGIPLGVFHFDCFWMREYQWCDFAWDSDVFPDAPAMLRRLKDRGLRICVWINPYIGQKSPLFGEAAEKGYLIKNRDGGAWQWDMWHPGMGIVDFTNPDAAAWYQGFLKRLMSEGVDCFKTDFGERIPVDCVYHDGSDPLKMHNYYAYLYNKVVFEAVREVKGENGAVLFARSAAVGGQQFPVHWGGDCEATYESMAESLRGGLSLSLCGFGFWSHDIGGFENTAAPDLYKRWVAFGLFSTHSRLHGSSSYRVPWAFDEESVDVLRFFTKQKCRLMPYIYAASAAAHKTGVPVMRPMVLEFQDDPVCLTLDRQYMFGPSVLVAPIFNPEGEALTYLPDINGGAWTHLLTGERREGGRFIREKYDYFGLPVYVRPNSLIACGGDGGAEYDYHAGAVIHAYEIGAEGAEADIVDTNGNLAYTVRAENKNGKLGIAVQGSHGGFTIIFHNLETRDSGFAAELPAGRESMEIQLYL